jgi:hypothetical protein
MQPRIGKESCRKSYSRRRSIREIDRHEDPSVWGLIRMTDHQDGTLDPPQQTAEGRGGEHMRERTQMVPTGHDEIDVERSRPRGDGTGGLSNSDIDTV